MQKVTSKDGTQIAYDKQGQGPPIILVAGALCARLSWSGPELAQLLLAHFTVFNYDRRGRGDSEDTKPYAIEREIEDIEALIDEAGGTALVYGHSSGAALALEAAIHLGNKVQKLAIYEAPYLEDVQAQQNWQEYTKELNETLSAGNNGDAVALFMKSVGMPAEQIAGMRSSPAWPQLEVLAPTLAYDAAILGKDQSIPIERAAQVLIPTLIMSGAASFPFMLVTAKKLSEAMPNAQLNILEGQTHDVKSAVLAPILVDFFSK